MHFYPRPPGGGRHRDQGSDPRDSEFLSTPSGWRATDIIVAFHPPKGISIHALWVEGDKLLIGISTAGDNISIHALRVEGDPCRPNSHHKNANFYPRPPGGGRRFGYRGFPPRRLISIHALRVEGDRRKDFEQAEKRRFLSTPSGWRATLSIQYSGLSRPISIHALRVEGDRADSHLSATPMISIHALRVEGDQLSRDCYHCALAFLSTPSGWRATKKWDFKEV